MSKRITRAMEKNALRISEVNVVYCARILVINLAYSKRKKTKAERQLMEAVFGLVELESRNETEQEEVNT